MDWDDIEEARDILGLDDRATLAEIKAAFRRQARSHHPDLTGSREDHQRMRRINHAYRVLMDYCAGFSFPLKRGPEDRPMNDEEWWLDRFGTDPLWGKSSPGGKKRR